MPSRYDLGPRPPLGYADDGLDRAADRRTDAAALLALEAAPAAGAYAIAGERVVMKASAGQASQSAPFDPLFTPAEARALGAQDSVFLGLTKGNAARFGFGIDAARAETLATRADLKLADLRAIAMHGLIADPHLAAIGEAKSLLSWHARHRFCANCGTETQVSDAGWRRDCAACKAQHFPRTDPVVIMLATDGDNCLLGRSGRFPPTMWSCLAGYIEPGETIEEAVRRETLEEAGIVCGKVSYFASQPWPFPSSLMIGCHAQALSREITVDTNELADARWFSRDETASMLMGTHPDKLALPRPIAIAYHIIREWVED